MKPFVLVATLVALVSGRPEPPSGYNYPRPGGGHHHGSIGGGLIGGGNNFQISSGQQHTSFGGHGGDFGGNTGFIGSNFGGHQSGGNFGSSSNHFSSSSSNFGTSGGNFGTSGSNFGVSGGNFGTSGGNFGVSGGNFGSSGSHFSGHTSGGGVTVQKHIYVHVPPPEPEEFRPQQQFPVGQAQKHYKIIFIKAPSPAAPTVPSIPLQAQNEEKTLVYVLVKKPDEQPELTIPTAAPTQPSKPEVYFIRYKTQKEQGGHFASTSNSHITSTGGDSGISGGITGGLTSGISTGISGGSDIITTGGSSSHHSTGASSVSTNYGPPGQSGPY